MKLRKRLINDFVCFVFFVLFSVPFLYITFSATTEIWFVALSAAMGWILAVFSLLFLIKIIRTIVGMSRSKDDDDGRTTDPEE